MQYNRVLLNRHFSESMTEYHNKKVVNTLMPTGIKYFFKDSYSQQYQLAFVTGCNLQYFMTIDHITQL